MEIREMIENLLDLTKGLSSWEEDFVYLMSIQIGGYSNTQKNKIRELWKKHFNSY